jgi:hypothetical protein
MHSLHFLTWKVVFPGLIGSIHTVCPPPVVLLPNHPVVLKCGGAGLAVSCECHLFVKHLCKDLIYYLLASM